MRREIVCGLDIGTSKISASLGEITRQNKFKLLGKARLTAEGVERGKVVDIEKLTKAIEKTMCIVQADTVLRASRIIMGLGTDFLKIQYYRRTTSISEVGKEIKSADIDRLISNAIEMAVPLDHEMIHVFPQEFIVDGQSKIRDPKGMFGTRLAARLLIMSVPATLLYNLKKCVYNSGYDIDSVVFSGLGSSFAFLTEEERNAGVIFLEIGGGITSVIKFLDNTPVFLEIMPFGGIDIDALISNALDIPLSEAKELKDKYGNLNVEQPHNRIILDKREIEITQMKLKQLIVPAIERILLQIKHRLENSNNLKYLPSGIILGGGSFLLEGLVEKAEEVFRLPVRLGVIRNVEDWTKDEKNIFLQSSSIGLIYFDYLNKTWKSSTQLPLSPFQKLIYKTKRVFDEYF